MYLVWYCPTHLLMLHKSEFSDPPPAETARQGESSHDREGMIGVRLEPCVKECSGEDVGSNDRALAC
jgi:hypothetical protein